MKIRLPVAVAVAATLATPAFAGGAKVRELTTTTGPAAHQELERSGTPAAKPAAKKPAAKKAKGLTKAQVLALVKREVAKSAKPGKVGPTGPTGPAGAANTSIPIQKISFKSNQGTTIAVPFTGPGMKIEAECAATFQLRFRATEAKGVVHAFAVGDQGVTYSAGFETASNSALDLVPNGEGLVSGKLEFTQFGTGTNVTVNYLAAYGSSQGDCVFTGTIVQA